MRLDGIRDGGAERFFSTFFIAFLFSALLPTTRGEITRGMSLPLLEAENSLTHPMSRKDICEAGFGGVSTGMSPGENLRRKRRTCLHSEGHAPLRREYQGALVKFKPEFRPTRRQSVLGRRTTGSSPAPTCRDGHCEPTVLPMKAESVHALRGKKA